ncbi:MAG: MmgE/PrpD family protein [Alphaproteobacteria bacterium]
MPDRDTVRQLALWVHEQDPARLPPAVSQQARLLVLDTIGCALCALVEDEVQQTIAAVMALGGAAHCTIIGTEHKTSAVDAVLANGAVARFLDLNDFVMDPAGDGSTSGGHPSDDIAVALSVGEWRRSSGAEVIMAIVIGYEIYCRLKALLTPEVPWDSTTVSGVVAPAMAGRLMGMEPERLAQAIALGAARAATPAIVRSGNISAAKFLANPLIAQSGTQAAILAAGGLTGPLEIFDHERGLKHMFEGGAGYASLTAPLKDNCAIMHAGIKAYPCLATGQTVVTAGIEIHGILQGETDGIESIALTMADRSNIRRQQADIGRTYPTSREAADHSFPFLAAVALMDGVLTPRQFDNERWAEAKTKALMARVSMGVDGGWNQRAPDAYPVTMRVTMADGARHMARVPHPPGHAAGGLEVADVTAKFDAITRGVLDDAHSSAIKATVLGLEDLSSVTELMDLLGAVTDS